MELHALDVEFSVTHAHDLAIVGPRRNFEAFRQRCAFDRERVVTDDGVGTRNILKDADAGVRGPGEMQMRSGFIAAICSSVMSSLRYTTTSCSSSPKYCTRL